MFNLIKELLFPASRTPATLVPKYQTKIQSGIIYCLPYRDPIIKQIIKTQKYEQDRRASQLLGDILSHYYRTQSLRGVHIIPIPQSYQRWRERGFDHLVDIVKASILHDQIRTDILKKAVHTKRQAHVSRAVRLTQQADTFKCHARASNLHGTVILFDDVMTTGATLRAAETALRQHLPRDTKLILLTLAH